jgi:20S proteasome subunit alpha 2
MNSGENLKPSMLLLSPVVLLCYIQLYRTCHASPVCSLQDRFSRAQSSLASAHHVQVTMRLQGVLIVYALYCISACFGFFSEPRHARGCAALLRGGASSSEERYSYHLTTFSPSGSLKQVEYAGAAVASGVLVIALKYDEGIVFASKRELPSVLVKELSTKKVSLITDTIAITYSGLTADSRVLAACAVQRSTDYAQKYGSDIPVSSLVRDLAALMQQYTQQPGVRPFGVSLLVAGTEEVDSDASDSTDATSAGAVKPMLYRVDPSGYHSSWLACAVGKRSAEAEEMLERDYKPGMTRAAAIELALSVVEACGTSSSSNGSESTGKQAAENGEVDVAVVEAAGVTLQAHLMARRDQSESTA